MNTLFKWIPASSQTDAGKFASQTEVKPVERVVFMGTETVPIPCFHEL